MEAPLTCNPIKRPPIDIHKMIENDLKAEEADVAHYKKLAEMAEKEGIVELKLEMGRSGGGRVAACGRAAPDARRLRTILARGEAYRDPAENLDARS